MFRTIALLGLLSCAAEAECSVVNAASYQPGLPSGGALATVFCTGVSAKPGLYVAPPALPLPFVLDGFRVWVNNSLAPLLAVYIPSAGPAQINFQVPLTRDSTSNSAGLIDNGTLTVGQDNNSVYFSGTIHPLPQPGIGGFFADANGYAIAHHVTDASPVTLDNPAHAGETIAVNADDFFPVWAPPPMGIPAPPQPLFQFDQMLPTFTPYLFAVGSFDAYSYLFLQDYPGAGPAHGLIAHTPALQIVFRGLAANQVGVEEIRFVVPTSQAPGDWPLFFNVGSCPDGSGACVPPSSLTMSSPYAKLPVR